MCQPLEVLSTCTNDSQLFESPVAIVESMTCIPTLLEKSAEFTPTTPETQLSP